MERRNAIPWIWPAALALFILVGLNGARRVRALRFWDAGLIFMILASLGAWDVAVVSRLGVEDPFWPLAMTHLFQDILSEGWSVLAVLGLTYAAHQPARLPPMS